MANDQVSPRQLFKHKPNCGWATPLPTGVGYWGCNCGLDNLLLELEDYEAQAACSQPVAPGPEQFDEALWEAVPGDEADSWGIRRAGEPQGKSIAQMMWVEDARDIVRLHNAALPAPPQVSTPRCPVCRSADLQNLHPDVQCHGCGKEFPTDSLADYAQFFQPAQPSPWVKTSERLPEDDSDVFAAIWWRNGDNPDYSRYAIHDCLYYEGGLGSGQKIFTDCEGEEFEPKDVQFWIYKKDLAATLPAQP